MHLHREARVGFLMLREDVFQKANPDQVRACCLVGVLPLLRSCGTGLVWAVSCVNAWQDLPVPALLTAEHNLPSQFPSQGCVWVVSVVPVPKGIKFPWLVLSFIFWD